MPSSGGSVSDAPVNKVVDGQSHYLAYITPDEGKSLQQQGGKEVITDSGIPAYPGGAGTPGGYGGGPDMGGGTGNGSGAPKGGHHQDTSESRAEQAKAESLNEQRATDRLNQERALDRLEKARTTPIDLPKKYTPTKQHIPHEDDIEDVEIRDYYDPNRYERKEDARDKSWKEHWDDRPEIIKYSPALSLLYATGANVAEWGSNRDWGATGDMGTSGEGGAGSGEGGRSTSFSTPSVSNAQSNFITSGQTQPTNSVAANWYQNLGSSSVSGQSSGFNLATEYAAAKAKVAQTLGTPSAVGQLAVSNSPLYNWLQTKSLNKGIL